MFVAFQATFAAITCCLILGAFAERAKFSAVLIFIVLWFTFAYAPIAHMVWFWMGPDAYTDREGGRRDERQGGPDLAVGRARLRRAARWCTSTPASPAWWAPIVIGKRIGFGTEAMTPHNLPMTMIGAALLWFGWFGFNAGSALEAGNSAALAFINTFLATACAVLSWSLRRVDVQGQAVDARRRFGCGGGPGRDHPGRRQRRHPGRVRDRRSRRARLPVGRERA